MELPWRSAPRQPAPKILAAVRSLRHQLGTHLTMLRRPAAGGLGFIFTVMFCDCVNLQERGMRSCTNSSHGEGIHGRTYGTVSIIEVRSS